MIIFHSTTMSSSRSRLHRSFSLGHTSRYKHSMPVLPPPQRPLVPLPEPKSAKPCGGKAVQSSDDKATFDVVHHYPTPSEPIPIACFEECPLKKERRLRDNEMFGGFSQTCSLCQKELNPSHDELYMYGYLDAFCSKSCRDDKMSIDGFHKEFGSQNSKSLERRRLLAAGTKLFFQRDSNSDCDYDSN